MSVRRKNLVKKAYFSTENGRFENPSKKVSQIRLLWRISCPPNVRQWTVDSWSQMLVIFTKSGKFHQRVRGGNCGSRVPKMDPFWKSMFLASIWRDHHLRWFAPLLCRVLSSYYWWFAKDLHWFCWFSWIFGAAIFKWTYLGAEEELDGQTVVVT